MKKHTQHKKRNIILLCIFIAFILLCLFFCVRTKFSSFRDYNHIGLDKNVSLFKNGHTFKKVYTVSDSHDRTIGLSYFEDFSDDEAMLFVFDYPAQYSFWMKGMSFPIDIIWIGENFTIVDIKEHANPQDFPENYIPREESLYVLELNDGFVDRHNLSLGQTLSLDYLGNQN